MRRLTALFLVLLLGAPAAGAGAPDERAVGAVVAQEIAGALDPPGIGAAVAIRIGGRTLFYNFGFADRAARAPVTPNSLFNLASVSKVFDATLLALAIGQGELRFDDPIAGHIGELRAGGDAAAITFGELATFTSGFSLPQDHPPWPYAHYTWDTFARMLNSWKIGKHHRRGRQYIYSHAGFMLLHVALERALATPYRALLEDRLLRPLGLASTTLPLRGPDSVGELAPDLARRAVQGYSGAGEPIGKPGDMQGYYHWPGTGQMFSSARDLRVSLRSRSARCRSTPRSRGRSRSRTARWRRSTSAVRASARPWPGRCTIACSPSSTRTAGSTTAPSMSGSFRSARSAPSC